jgi:hypothetical protein
LPAMNLMSPVEQLRHAQEVMKEAETAWREDIFNDELRLRADAAEKDLLAAERLVAAAEGHSYAIEWQHDGEWPRMPQGASASVGSFMAVVTFDKAAGASQVIFDHPDAFRFSNVSDEVIAGHSLFGKGLRAYGLFLVENSSWINELKKCDSVHPQHNSSHWEEARHYMLCFKDRICEVVTSCDPVWKSFSTRIEALQSALMLCESFASVRGNGEE